MDLILISDVPNLGEIGDLVKVKPGYGRNFLLPKKLAIPASTKSKKRLEHEKRVAAHKLAQSRAGDEGIAKQIGQMNLMIKRRAGENNKLFGSVTSQDVVVALREAGVTLDRRRVVLEEPIRQVGEHEVTVKVRQDLPATLKITVAAE
jgi:large subunit ribosomal protein L9